MSALSPSNHTSTAESTPWVLDGVLVLRSSTNSRYRSSQKKDRSGVRHDGQDDRRIPLREKASWRTIKALGISSSSPPATAQWRRAKLMLNENLHLHSRSTVMLTVRYDDTSDDIILYINHCNSTDLRIVDQSLFELPNCLGIYNNSLKNNGDHVFIHFPTSDSLRYWFALLRAFAIAEIYGAGAVTDSQGGTYRIARSIEIEIQHGRNVGIGLGSTPSATRKAAPLDLASYASTGFGGGLTPNPLPHLLGGRKRSNDPFQAPVQRDQIEASGDNGFQDVFCEVELGGDVCARSSVRRTSRTSESIATAAETSWAWHTWNEKFFLSDLPPFMVQNALDGDNVDHGTLCINLYRVIRQRQGNSIPFGGGIKKISYSSPSLSTSSSFGQFLSGTSIFNSSQPLSASPSVGLYSLDTQSSLGPSGAQPVPIGSIRIPLENFRRNEWVMGYYPIISSTQSGPPGSNHIGDMMLKLKCQEDVIVPLDRYSKLIQFLTSNPFSLISDIMERTSSPLRPDAEAKMDTASKLVDISFAGGTLIENLCEAVQHELVDAKAQIIFRDNTPCTAAVQQAMFKLGQPFLETSLRPAFRRLLSELRASEENVDDFPRYLEEIWRSIHMNRHKCPEDLRRLFSHIIQQVKIRFPNSAQSGSEFLPLQSITSLCFLRFFVPAIMNPGMFGLVRGALASDVEIKLKHVSRVIQAMANFKDPSNMYNEDEATREFMSKNQSAMQEYVKAVSTLPSSDKHPTGSSSESVAALDHHALVSKVGQLPVLHRESIPLNSSMIDYPRQLASLASSIVSYARWPRGVRDLPTKQPKVKTAATGGSGGFLECAAICFAIETETLTAVVMLNPEANEEGEQESSGLVAPQSVEPAPSTGAGMVFTPRAPDYEDIFTQSPSPPQGFLTSLQGFPGHGLRRHPK